MIHQLQRGLPRHLSSVTALAFAALLAACGGGDGAAASDASTSVSSTAATAATATTAAASTTAGSTSIDTSTAASTADVASADATAAAATPTSTAAAADASDTMSEAERYRLRKSSSTTSTTSVASTTAATTNAATTTAATTTAATTTTPTTSTSTTTAAKTSTTGSSTSSTGSTTTASTSTATTTTASATTASASSIVPMAFQTAAMTNASQPANQMQVMGSYPALNTIPESGITGNGTINGTNIRFGKVADPTGTIDPATGKVRQVYMHAVAAGDPTTACCYRTDVAPANGSLQKDTPYWVAMEVYIPSSTMNSGDGQTIAAIHEGPDDGSGNWEFQINYGKWVIQQTTEGQNKTWTTLSYQPAADAWHKIVVQFTLSLTNGVTNIWIDGKQVMAYKGINTVAASGDYAKFGLYAFMMTSGTRYDLWRSYYLVKDKGYTLDQVTALLQ